jgi:hypothetical protein
MKQFAYLFLGVLIATFSASATAGRVRETDVLISARVQVNKVVRDNGRFFAQIRSANWPINISYAFEIKNNFDAYCANLAVQAQMQNRGFEIYGTAGANRVFASVIGCKLH